MKFVNDGARVMASESASPATTGLPGDVIRLAGEFRQLAHDHLELATLETKLSIVTLIRMGIFAIFTALVLVSAWLALLASAALGLISVGVTPVVAMLVVTAANLLAAFLGWLKIRRLTHWLGWAATLRAIKSPPVTEEKRSAA